MTKLTENKGRGIQAKSESPTPFEELDHMFDNLLGLGFLQPFEWRWGESPLYRSLHEQMPRIDLIEREDSILVRAEVPGVRKEDLDLTLTDDRLTIKGQTKKEEREETGDFYRSEIRSGSFSRTIALPTGFIGEQAKAQFEDGLLEISIPKAEKATQHKVDIE